MQVVKEAKGINDVFQGNGSEKKKDLMQKSEEQQCLRDGQRSLQKERKDKRGGHKTRDLGHRS